jgi:hypothetical protein
MWGTQKRSILEPVKGFVAFVGIVITVGGATVLGWQSYGWLKRGQWVPLSLYGAVEKYKGADSFAQSWVVHPQSWFGLHKVLLPVMKWMPLSACLLVLGFVLFSVFISLMDSKRGLNEPL